MELGRNQYKELVEGSSVTHPKSGLGTLGIKKFISINTSRLTTLMLIHSNLGIPVLFELFRPTINTYVQTGYEKIISQLHNIVIYYYETNA